VNGCPSEYKNYDARLTTTIEDQEKNILIVPEICIEKLNAYNFIQKGVWWLSVDNAIRGRRKRGFKRFKLNLMKHFTNSSYAEYFLVQNKVQNCFPLTGYLNGAHLENDSRRNSNIQREDIVLYNPRKGYEITKDLLRSAPEFKWVPIDNLKPAEIASLMRKSKVYVDFGYHPGKERIPKEAVINGCCVIVGMRGSAAFFRDVPILDRYKFNVVPVWGLRKHFVIPRILERIRDCLSNYESRAQDFDFYRRVVRQDKQRFQVEIAQIFGLGQSSSKE